MQDRIKDPEYEAAKHVLRAPLIAERTRPYVGDDSVDWVGLEREAQTMSGGARLLVAVASDLWSAQKQTGISDLPRRLDEANFERVLDALRIARGTMPPGLAEELAA